MTLDTDGDQFIDEIDEPQVEYDPETRQWFWIAGALAGTVVLNATIIAEMEIHTAAINPLFQAITGQFYAGEITVAQWQTALATELQEAHLAQAMFGAGGETAMTAERLAILQDTLTKEFSHLDDFASGIIDGIISERQAFSRINQYANAIEQSYWNQWKVGLDDPTWSDLPLLTQVPGDGQTQCHGNCVCWLEFTDSGVNWILNPASHCPDCPVLASGGPYRVQ